MTLRKDFSFVCLFVYLISYDLQIFSDTNA